RATGVRPGLAGDAPAWEARRRPRRLTRGLLYFEFRTYEFVSRRARAPVTRPRQMCQPRRVVVTGMGAVSPNGIGLPRFADAIRNGRSGVSRIESFDPAPYATQIGGEVRDFDAASVLQDSHDLKHIPRAAVMAMAAGDEALRSAGLDARELPIDE